MSDLDTVRELLTTLQARLRPLSSAAYIEALPDDDAYKIATRALAALAAVEKREQRLTQALTTYLTQHDHTAVEANCRCYLCVSARAALSREEETP